MNEELLEYLFEQKRLKIQKKRAKFRAKLRYPKMDDKEFEKHWKIVISTKETINEFD